MCSFFPLSLKGSVCLSLRLWPVARQSSHLILHHCRRSQEMLLYSSTHIILVKLLELCYKCLRVSNSEMSYRKKAMLEHNTSPGLNRQARCFLYIKDSSMEQQTLLMRSL